MPRVAALISSCSVILVAGWLLVGHHEVGPVRDGPAVHPGLRGQGLSASLNRLPNAEKGLLQRPGQGLAPGKPKRKPSTRGVAVNRAKIVEAVTMADLMAPKGRLWIPAAISGPIDKKLPDPLFNVLVAYCQLDMAAYHETPWMFAMGTFHQRQSGCLDDESLVRTYRLSSLMRLVDENPDDFVDPSGFIYHETRCGSTLSANMIASVPTNIVHSETPPPIAVLNMCATAGKCPDGMREKVVRTVFRLMGPKQDGHTNLFFKFQSSKYAPAIGAAWPDVKWIYLFRDPLEVISSNLKGAWRKVGANAPRNVTQPLYNLGGPCVRGLRGGTRGVGGKPGMPSPTVMVDACVKQLETLNEVALREIRDKPSNGIAVEYRQLPEVIAEYVYPEHFGMATSELERNEAKRFMEPVTHMYSKGMATPSEAAVSKDFQQGMDLEVKEAGSDEAMRAGAASMCNNYRSLVGLQRWRKAEEGGTMGTCNRR